jgi:hypothetical protein
MSTLDYCRPREINGLLVAVSNHALRRLFQHFLLNVSRVKFPELVVAYRQEQSRASGERHDQCSQEFDSHSPPQTVFSNTTSGAGSAGTPSRIYFVDFSPRKNRTRGWIQSETVFSSFSPKHRFAAGYRQREGQGCSGSTGNVAGFTDEGSSRSLM